ncbi:MAG: GNAT family N-acetyltransferase, partial [Anaerolineales bacterium]
MSAATQAEACDFLEWDSEFFGARIARLKTATPDAAGMQAALAWCRRERIDCLYFLADSTNPAASDLAQDHQFRLVDLRVTLAGAARANTAAASPASLRAAEPSDAERLKAIARVSHRDTRFYADEHFPAGRCDALYETWIEKSVNGYADCVLMAEENGQALGYVACHLKPAAAGQIGLLAVAPGAQQRGLGQHLLRAALDWFHGHGVERVTVVTQGRNVKAQRLYQRAGFVTESIHLWYHAWLNSAWAAQQSFPQKADNGRQAFQNGGLRCSTCHSVAGSSGTLAVNLTDVYTKMGETGLVSACE